MPSVLIWSSKIPFKKRLELPLLFLLEKVFDVPFYHRNALQGLIGKDVSETIERIRYLPPVPGGVAYFRRLSDQGYKIIVMSYSPGVFVSPWLNINCLKAELICPSLVMTADVVQKVSQDPVTKTYLRESKRAKSIILAKMGIDPDICVGDNKHRDGLCDTYVDIRKLEPQYKNKVQQALHNLDKLL